jgi:ABC-type multidrug transport system fused ATPase/permease subunit
MNFFNNLSFENAKILLSYKQINSTFLLFFLMLLAMIFEVVVLQLILLILGYFSGASSINFDNYLNFLKSFLANYSDESLLITSFIFVFFLKNLISIYVSKRENKFLTNLRADLSFNFYKDYLDMPLIYKLKKNSSEIIRNITNEVDFLVATIFSLSIFTMEILVIIGIMFVLLNHNFILSLIAIILFIFFSFIFNFLNKKKIIKLGNQRGKYLKNRLKNIIETFSSFKELELAGKLDAAKSEFNFNNNQISKINYITNFRNTLSKPVFELFLVFILFIIVFLFNISKSNIVEFIPTIGIFLVASYRLIPSLSRIISALQRIQLNSQSIPYLVNEKLIFKKTKIYKFDKEIHFRNEIEFKNVKFSYKNKPCSEEDFIINNLNLKISKGSSIGIFGLSGQGKSTFLDLLIGFLPCYSGNIFIDKISLTECSDNWQKKIFSVPQDIFIKNDTIKKNIAFFEKNEEVNIDKINQVLKTVNLDQVINGLDDKIDTVIGDGGLKLSGGQKQRISIARALYYGPEVLIFDESTNSIDTYNENLIVNNILKNFKNATIIWVSHRKEIFKNFNKLFEIKNGKLLEEKL